LDAGSIYERLGSLLDVSLLAGFHHSLTGAMETASSEVARSEPSEGWFGGGFELPGFWLAARCFVARWFFAAS
jgi:hypothetical protein